MQRLHSHACVKNKNGKEKKKEKEVGNILGIKRTRVQFLSTDMTVNRKTSRKVATKVKHLRGLSGKILTRRMAWFFIGVWNGL